MTVILSAGSQAQEISENIRTNAINAGVNPAAFDKVKKYYNKNKSKLENKKFLAFVDFKRPSTKERLFVVNLNTGKVSKFLVTHGKNSGDNYATRFSNKNNSEKSALGLYKIQDEYKGKHGSSLRLVGLENGLDQNNQEIPDSQINGITNGKNSNALIRSIVMHSAYYAKPESIKANNNERLGRSQGCPAVSPEDWKILEPRLKNGSLLLLYK